VTALYYEGHAIFRPTGPQKMAWLDVMRSHGWWASKLTHEAGPDNLEAKDDFILTTRGPGHDVLEARIKAISQASKGFNLQLLRYKIEAATLDSKHGDSLKLLDKGQG
jgi:hypothetical protein